MPRGLVPRQCTRGGKTLQKRVLARISLLTKSQIQGEFLQKLIFVPFPLDGPTISSTLAWCVAVEAAASNNLGSRFWGIWVLEFGGNLGSGVLV